MMERDPSLATELRRHGFALIPDGCDATTLTGLRAALDTPPIDGAGISLSRRAESVYAVRNLLSVSSEVREFARSAAIRRVVEPILGPDCFAVRGILFDKTPGANWNVVWHQDLSIAVRERPVTISADRFGGWGPWSEKAGVVHVQPPVEWLERMVTTRIHLDHCGPEDGPLRVLAGSHRAGRLDATAISDWRERVPETVCTVEAGGIVLMRPLLLHASSRATSVGRRRVVHLEWAAEDLPDGLCWSETVR